MEAGAWKWKQNNYFNPKNGLFYFFTQYFSLSMFWLLTFQFEWPELNQYQPIYNFTDNRITQNDFSTYRKFSSEK